LKMNSDENIYSADPAPVDDVSKLGKDANKMTTLAATEQQTDRIEAQSTITSRGQITFPAKIMKKLGLKEGDLLRFIYEAGELHVEAIPLLSEEDLFGSLDRPEDQGHFVLNLESARDERTVDILLTKYPDSVGGDQIEQENGDLD